MKVNATKTTYTVFSLSNKEQTVNLKLEGQKLKQDKCPTYLGITFDPRLTWKHQIEKAQTKGIQRLSILKKLAGTQWGANADILKKTYKGYVRPALEYGMSAWGSTAPSNFLKNPKKSSKPRPPPYNRQPSINTHSRNGICYRTSIPRTEKRHENPHTAVQIHVSKKSPNALKSRKETPKTSEKVQLSRVCTNPTKTSRNSTL